VGRARGNGRGTIGREGRKGRKAENRGAVEGEAGEARTRLGGAMTFISGTDQEKAREHLQTLKGRKGRRRLRSHAALKCGVPAVRPRKKESPETGGRKEVRELDVERPLEDPSLPLDM